MSDITLGIIGGNWNLSNLNNSVTTVIEASQFLILVADGVSFFCMQNLKATMLRVMIHPQKLPYTDKIMV